jgi:hypothetical protein
MADLTQQTIVETGLCGSQMTCMRHVVCTFHAGKLLTQLLMVNVKGRQYQHWQEYCQQHTCRYFPSFHRFHGCKGTDFFSLLLIFLR